MATISENLEALQTVKANIKSAIEGKGQDLTNVPFTQYGEKIEAIQTGLDISDTTATENDVLDGKVFYNASGEKTTGAYVDRLQLKIDRFKSLKYLFNGLQGVGEITVDDIMEGLDTSEVTDTQYMFHSATSLTSAPLFNTANVQNMNYMFYNCDLITIPQYNMESVTTTQYMFYGCEELTEVPPLNTPNLKDARYMFTVCKKLTTIHSLNLISATSLSSMLSSTTNLTNLYLKNIKANLTIGSGTSYGHLLTLDSLLNTIKELHTNTATSTRTLTIGSANLEKLANVYVKLIDITDEMRAEDEYIDNKLPFVQCESTDEGAMLITEYVTNVKNWQLA